MVLLFWFENSILEQPAHLLRIDVNKKIPPRKLFTRCLLRCVITGDYPPASKASKGGSKFN